ncbi:very-short-patch-repair endonuclease [Schumannella luteola]|uniref:Very-short-patch-repair endonuclease n=1 Tax=Schumannella luteola TaxID=472059 RepID=A0A852YRV6_9MICO|nr:hypothetical protein [Schumannella luteola]NYH00440.1 very-short-patch-repair endonuclease [Schumannella luteola]
MTRIVRTRDFAAEGVSTAELRHQVAAGGVRRLRIGHYAVGELDPPVEAAVSGYCSLSCGAALERHGIWVRLATAHWRVSPSDRVRRSRVGEPIRHRIAGRAVDGVDDVLTALACAAQCMSFEDLVCCVDSARHLRAVTRPALARTLLTRNGIRALAVSDARSESGLETLARIRLRSRGIVARPQVVVPGVGRVDLVVGDRLVIELDGDRWHSTPETRERDRRRDAELVARGALVLHAGSRRVFDEWAPFEAQILALVHRGEHRWSARRRREQSDLGREYWPGSR